MPGEHIVIIDDDPDVREALRLMLEPSGYRITCCATGPEGIEAVLAIAPNLIMLDIMLASPSEGFHVAYELRRGQTTRMIPIIMISSIGETMGLDYAKELGSEYIPVDKFLEKPLTVETVLTTVQEVLKTGSGTFCAKHPPGL